MAPGSSRIRAALALLAVLAATGCADLLPRARNEAGGPWSGYEEARATVGRIVPYRTTAGELKALGIDPFATPNVQVLNFSEVLLRFPVTAGLPWEKLDRGLRECLEAGNACEGLAVSARDLHRDRVGNFWLDALAFDREVDVKGWSFSAIVLVTGGRVVYVTHGGQPLIRERESNRQPLGPLQGWGDMLPGWVK